MNPMCNCSLALCGGMCGGSCCGTGACPITMMLIFIGWILISSGLLFYTWNRVISYLFNTKIMKFWQVLLLVATLSFICSPKFLMHKAMKGGKGQCATHQCKEGCPIHSQKGAMTN